MELRKLVNFSFITESADWSHSQLTVGEGGVHTGQSPVHHKANR